MHAVRREGRSEPRILYWFRTPPFVKVGRTALDEEAIRLLEERHPDITFDWTRILREPPQPISPAEAEKRRDAREAREARRRKRSRREDPLEPPAERESRAERYEREPVEAAGAAAPPPIHSFEIEPLEGEEGVGAPEPADLTEAGELAEPVVAEETAGGAGPSEPLLQLVGREGLTRLRARYASLMARIAEVADEVRREALRLEAERLNPEVWLTAEEARAALETYEASYEALRLQLGGGRRRRRRRGRGRGQKPV
jgi:hypothetical protein